MENKIDHPKLKHMIFGYVENEANGKIDKLIDLLNQYKKDYPNEDLRIALEVEEFFDTYTCKLRIFALRLETEEEVNERIRLRIELCIEEEKLIRQRDYEQYLKLKEKFENCSDMN